MAFHLKSDIILVLPLQMHLLLGPKSKSMSMIISCVPRYVDGLVRSDWSDHAYDWSLLIDPFDSVQYVHPRKKDPTLVAFLLPRPMSSDSSNVIEHVVVVALYSSSLFYCRNFNIIATMLEDQKLNMFILPSIHPSPSNRKKKRPLPLAIQVQRRKALQCQSQSHGISSPSWPCLMEPTW